MDIELQRAEYSDISILVYVPGRPKSLLNKHNFRTATIITQIKLPLSLVV
jgi:hypothetical protein